MLLLQAGIMIVVFVTLTLHGSYDTQTDYGMYGTEDRFGCKVCNIGEKNGINVCTHCKIGWEKEPFACKKCQFGSEAGKYDCQLCRRKERSQGGTKEFPSIIPLFIKYTIRSIVCETFCHPGIWVIWVILVNRVLLSSSVSSNSPQTVHS